MNFSDLNLPEPVLKALSDLNYETPTPVQAASIPHVLNGEDILAKAQTGTGKTAAFALPLLANLDCDNRQPQILVLSPTRELALQTSDAFTKYAKHMRDVTILPIYGGKDYTHQLRVLRKGAQIVIGTPGRVIDHIKRGTLNVSALKTIVLDEADNMLQMGFIDDVEWVFSKTPADRQVALFSATIPGRINNIVKQYLKNPARVDITPKEATAPTISQSFLVVKGRNKFQALARLLEFQDTDATIIFVRTKSDTIDVSEKLQQLGLRSAPLNGDISQRDRERAVQKLKDSKLDIIVATDVAARGLDVPRISHVINYDMPFDTDSYVHRIGRTGRAGRQGNAILFITPVEKRLLRNLERVTKQTIEAVKMPSVQEIQSKRIQDFKTQLVKTTKDQKLDFYTKLIEECAQEHELSPIVMAAALAKQFQKTPLEYVEHLEQESSYDRRDNSDRRDYSDRRDRRGSSDRRDRRDFSDRRDRRESSDRRDRRDSSDRRDRRDFSDRGDRRSDRPSGERKSRPFDNRNMDMCTYRIEIGSNDGVKPRNIVGAIANEINMDSRLIGSIDIQSKYSTVDLPSNLQSKQIKILEKTWVAGKQMQLQTIN